MSESWIDTGPIDRILPEDVAPFEHEGKQYALYRTADDRYFATDGLCTHESVELADGFVQGTIIECPMHNGRFDYTSGKALGAPLLTDLRTYAAKVVDGTVYIDVG